MQDVSYEEYAESDPPPGTLGWARLILKWAGALLSFALVVMIVVWAYRLGVRDAREIPVIKALDGPLRVRPADPGGTEIANQGLEVNEILGGSEAQIPSEARLAPATIALPEEDTAPPEDAPEMAAPAPGAAPEAEPDPDDVSAAIEAALAEVLGEGAGEEPAEAPGAPAAEIGGATTAAVRPRQRPASLSVLAPPDEAPSPPPVAAAPQDLPIDPAELEPGTRLVQLGAFNSADQAEEQWARLVGAHADLLETKRRYIQRAESNGRIFYRLRVVGFDNREAQRAICDALKARAVDCIPVTVR